MYRFLIMLLKNSCLVEKKLRNKNSKIKCFTISQKYLYYCYNWLVLQHYKDDFLNHIFYTLNVKRNVNLQLRKEYLLNQTNEGCVKRAVMKSSAEKVHLIIQTVPKIYKRIPLQMRLPENQAKLDQKRRIIWKNSKCTTKETKKHKIIYLCLPNTKNIFA